MRAQEWHGIGRDGVSASWDAAARAAGHGGKVPPSPAQTDQTPARKSPPVATVPLGRAAASWEAALLLYGVKARPTISAAPIAPLATTPPPPPHAATAPPPRTPATASATPPRAVAPPPHRTAVASAGQPAPRALASRITVTHARRMPDQSGTRCDAITVACGGVRVAATLTQSRQVGTWVSLPTRGPSPDPLVTRTEFCNAALAAARRDIPAVFSKVNTPNRLHS